MTGSPQRSSAARLLLTVSLVLVAFNARPALSSIGPVLPEAMQATGLSPASAGLLTTLPVVFLGVFGLAAPWIARRIGAERAVLASLLLLAAGLGLRAFGTEAPLVLGCALGGVAIGVANVLLPGIIKREFADKAAALTGLYTMGLCGGAAVAAGAAVPLAHALGGWSYSLAFWALPALLAAAVWTIQSRGATAPVTPPGPGGGLWREGLAWQVTAFTGTQSALAYCVFAWLAPILRDRGFSPVEAGFIVSVSILIQAPAALVAPILAVKGRDQRLTVLITTGLTIIGLAGCLYAPTGSIWLWAAILGLGQGSVFAVALTLIVLRAPDAATAARLSSMAQGIGYIAAAGGPLLMGLFRGWSGSWDQAGALFFVIAAAGVAAGLGAGRAIQVRGRPDPRPAPAAA